MTWSSVLQKILALSQEEKHPKPLASIALDLSEMLETSGSKITHLRWIQKGVLQLRCMMPNGKKVRWRILNPTTVETSTQGQGPPQTFPVAGVNAFIEKYHGKSI